ncbi:hypothetical protein COCON_G00226370 [Conger conger]|uniref:C-type lectin domain-containing protein n=1 Tax=Conger conger TaxID=82655 RepID=A0A9Q1CW87_CONCO|nr:hypothetical protein COCON_G00226370 [Conger conger]
MAASTTIIPEGTYANLDSPDHHVYSTVNPTTQKNSGPRKTGKRLAVALGLLCVILLTATITLCVLYMTALDGLKAQNDQLQKDYDNLMRQCRPTPPSSSCPESWKSFSSKCYLFTQTKQKWDDCRTYCKEQGADLVTQMQKSWNDNHKYCKEQGADLVIINNEDEQNFTNQNAVEGEYWIGLHDPDPNKSCFRWVDGTRPQTTFWKPGAPDEQRNHEECVFTGPEIPGLQCSQPPGVGRGLSRRLLPEANGAHRPHAPSQSAVAVLALASICNVSCSILDPMPLPQARDSKPAPLSSSCPESWKSFSCKCYLFVQTKRNWDDCRTHCQEQGADLVIINNEAEQEFISQNAGNIEEYWTGLYDPEPTQSFFRWVDGTRPQKTFWKPGEPDGKRNQKGCAYTGPGALKWGSTNCVQSRWSICER